LRIFERKFFLSDSSVVVVVVEPEWWEPEAWRPEALEPGARESRLGAIPEVGLLSPLREFSERSVIRLIGGARC
jgi:hypothetical protein